jgi:hypothetical protein
MALPMKGTGRVFLSDVLRGEPLAFESTKTLHDHLRDICDDDVVYEDDLTIAYIHRTADHGSTTHWTHKIAIALKAHVPTLLDLDVSDARETGALLRAIQAVAYKLNLFETGFEIRADILPPLQRKGYLEISVRSGKQPDDALAQVAATE